jgi:hypothetical protein
MPIEFEYTEDIDNDEVEDIEESGEIEEIEFDMSNEEIDEWVNELMRLKEEQESINLQIDKDLFLKINYVDEN